MGVSRGMILVFLIGLIGCSLLIGSTEANIDVGYHGAIEDRENGHELPRYHVDGYEPSTRKLSEGFDDETLLQDDMVLGH